MKTCIIDSGSLLEGREYLLDSLREYGEVSVFSGTPLTVEEVVERASDADIIGFGFLQFTNEMIDALPNLKILQFIGTGMWNFVDVDYAESKGIKVLNIDAYGSNAVAEYAVSCILALVRNITRADAIVKRGDFNIDGLIGKEIAGSTIGVVGTGSIGKLVAQKLIGLEANVIVCDIFENEELKSKYGLLYVSMEELFEKSDIITLHMKVTKENSGVVNAALFNRMKMGTHMVNVARAELVNFNDMVDALDSGKLAGVAIDVFQSEPPLEEEIRFANRPEVIATPHVGFYTQQANDNSFIMSADSIITELTKQIGGLNEKI